MPKKQYMYILTRKAGPFSEFHNPLLVISPPCPLWGILEVFKHIAK
jgi:hypothetical protein